MNRASFFLTLIGILGFLAYYFKSYPLPETAQASLISPSHFEDQELYKELLQSPIPPTVVSAQNTLEVQKCFQNHALLASTAQGSSFHPQDLKKIPGAQWTSLDQINVHFQKKGEHFRVSIVKESPSRKQIRLFKEDKDGFPTRLALPEEWNDMKSAEILRIIKKESTVTSLQKKTLWEINKNTHLRFDEENGKVRDLMVFFKDEGNQNHALGCHRGENNVLSCQCI